MKCGRCGTAKFILFREKKYRKSNFFKGSKADQIMNHGSMGNPKLWEEEIFGAAEQHPMDIKK